ncbi:leucine-rich repeat flightless-interacting protein 2 isoform X26 [Equus przewalskii]|uniref:Leucine-rich repeat flightless-interacting protein 2 n=1 Tax=Equus przewalskii TaxID=9798 RepID=A0ABM2F7B6_EQUPR|nr:PREDICTED: leucine-rich repeat flightless-interacting protein 2 isoform X9 [Equus przewalskii]XP_014586959.1 leucine-rich repeat flightless-interacting protein 2 isoform X26 [Equus caballus]
MGTPGSGRKRTPMKDRFSAEDEALSNIAREAEARLAAKRAARAEARDIRMRELERQQKEHSHHSFDRKWGQIQKWLEDSERARYSHRSSHHRPYLGVEDALSVRSLGSHRNSLKDITGTDWSRASTPKRRDIMYDTLKDRSSRLSSLNHSSSHSYRMKKRSSGSHKDPLFDEKSDKQYAENYTRPSSRNSASATTPLSGNSSRRGSGDTSSLIDPDASLSELRDIYDLKDQIQDVEGRYMQGLKELKESLSEVEEKYKKAMVSNAQLDNEKNNLIYQVDTLKDVIEEQEEQMAEFYRENEEKSKELERQKHMCSVLQHKMDELKEGLRQRDELIEENQRMQEKIDTMTKEVFDLQETLLWKDKNIRALEKQKEYIACLRSERDALREELADLKETEKTGEKHGLVIIPDGTPNGDVNHEPVVGAITVVSQEAAQVLESAGEGPLDVRLRKLAGEKEELLSQIRKLKLQLEEERQKCSRSDSTVGGVAGLQNGSDLQFIEMQRDANRQISEYKFKLSKAEQDITTLEQSISRLEGQVLRYKTAAENAEKVEDELKAEKRKLQRELRTALDKIEEMEMTNSHLAKRLEKMKANRTALLAQQ